MARPQWKEPTIGLEDLWGLDKRAAPPWFTVGQGETKELLLDFAEGKLVRNRNERIVTLAEDGKADISRVFEITGRMAARMPVPIEVIDRRTGRVESVLHINVKSRRTLGIAFHFVEDRAGDRTVRQQSIVDELISDLNNIFMPQTSVLFDVSGAAETRVNVDLDDVVIEDRTKSGRATGQASIVGKQLWRDIFARNSDRNALNVYFVPTDDPAKNRNVVPYVDIHNLTPNCVIEDGREPLDFVLPHAVGRMLMGGVTTDANDMQQLMYFDEILRRTGNFIPKSVANIMNP